MVRCRVNDSNCVSHVYQHWHCLRLGFKLWLRVAIRVGVIGLGLGMRLGLDLET